MSCIHLIEKRNLFRKLSGDLWESGYWHVTEQTAQKLKGGSIYFHRKQKAPSYSGGTILNYRIAKINDSVQYAGRIIFIFSPKSDHNNKKPIKKGWSNEKKIEW